MSPPLALGVPEDTQAPRACPWPLDQSGVRARTLTRSHGVALECLGGVPGVSPILKSKPKSHSATRATPQVSAPLQGLSPGPASRLGGGQSSGQAPACDPQRPLPCGCAEGRGRGSMSRTWVQRAGLTHVPMGRPRQAWCDLWHLASRRQTSARRLHSREPAQPSPTPAPRLGPCHGEGAASQGFGAQMAEQVPALESRSCPGQRPRR